MVETVPIIMERMVRPPLVSRPSAQYIEELLHSLSGCRDEFMGAPLADTPAWVYRGNVKSNGRSAPSQTAPINPTFDLPNFLSTLPTVTVKTEDLAALIDQPLEQNTMLSHDDGLPRLDADDVENELPSMDHDEYGSSDDEDDEYNEEESVATEGNTEASTARRSSVSLRQLADMEGHSLEDVEFEGMLATTPRKARKRKLNALEKLDEPLQVKLQRTFHELREELNREFSTMGSRLHTLEESHRQIRSSLTPVNKA
eukprot:Colp12_sorted_trinity150504_noHs@9354